MAPKDMNRSGAVILRTPDPNQDRKNTLESLVLPSMPPVHVEVNLDAVVANAREVQASVGPRCGVLAMLKADAYGHGLLPVAMTLQQDRTIAGIVVSSIRDGLTLRREGITLPIIALVCRYGNRHGVVLDAGITPMLGGLADLEAFSRAARARNRRVDVHVELDTGMSRSGVRDEDLSSFLNALAENPAIVVAGLCTQLASADEEHPVSAHRQLDAFEDACSRFRAAGHVPTMIHAANTAATVRMPRSHFTHVRVGIALFGGDEPSGTELRPAMRVTTRIVQLRSIGPGESVGYGEKWKAERRSQIATLPVGYAHGYPRRLLGRAEVIVRGRRCPLVGSICMEMTMVDVTDVDGVALDDEVILVGESGVTEIRVAELARAMDGIVEEFLCAVPKAAIRTYTRHST
jgi:alanine racemase